MVDYANSMMTIVHCLLSFHVHNILRVDISNFRLKTWV
jgi:hypothetical protein